MCWFTLTPTKGKKKPNHSSDSSCVEEIVRIRRNSSPRFSDVRVKIPSSVTMELERDHHHHHHLHPPLNHRHPHLHPHMPHLHPLHMHPIHGHHHPHHSHHSHHDSIRLRGSGRKRCPCPPTPPPPTRDPSRHRPRSRSPSECRSPSESPREPIYRTQIVEPASVRETTRVALRTVESDRPRGRLRRVAGYEVLGREVPWNWDCVSSTVGSSTAAGGVKWVRRKTKSSSSSSGGGLKYPPFGTMEKWL